MPNNLKGLLAATTSDKALFVQRRHEQSVSKDVHRALIAQEAVPLRGDYQKIPSIMNALQSLGFMTPKKTVLALVIDDDKLTKEQLEVIRNIAVDRTYMGRKVEVNVRVVIVSDIKPSMAKDVFGENLVLVNSHELQRRQEPSALSA